MNYVIIVVTIFFAVVIYIMMVYNKLSTLRYRVTKTFNRIDKEIKTRSDVITNLEEFLGDLKITELQGLRKLDNELDFRIDGNFIEMEKKSKEMSELVISFFKAMIPYIDIRNQAGYVQLQDELNNCEKRLKVACFSYNLAVKNYNNRVKHLRNRLLVKFFNFQLANYFIKEEEKRDPYAR